MANPKVNLVVGGKECITPSQYFEQLFIREKKIRDDIRKNLKQPEYFSERYPYKKLTLKEKQSEENEDIAFQRLRTDVHRDYTGSFAWLLFKVRRELAHKKSEPLFFSQYGHIYTSKNLPYLLDLCWEMEVYGHCIFYNYKRYPKKVLEPLIDHLGHARDQIVKARNIILSQEDDRKKHTAEMLSTLGRSMNVPANFTDNLLHEFEIMQFELADLKRLAELDYKLPKPDPDAVQRKLQYFIYLGEEIFKRISFQYFFPDLDLSNSIIYNRECKNFLVQIAKDLDQIRATDPSTIKNAYDRKKKYKMKYVGLHKAKNFNEFSSLLKKINL